MKTIIKSFRYLVILSIIQTLITGCNDPVTDFGYNGSISGKVSDASGNLISGDPNVAGIEVKALGEQDNIPMIMRVKGEGTYANIKLYPQSYKVWITGPVFSPDPDTIVLNLKEQRKQTQDFVVTPFLTIPSPTLEGSASATEITINYSITGNNGMVPNLREIICSTTAYPNSTTGNGTYWSTKKVTVTDDQGTATISGLTSGTKYFVRVGARAGGQSLFNYSDQIVVTTP